MFMIFLWYILGHLLPVVYFVALFFI